MILKTTCSVTVTNDEGQRRLKKVVCVVGQLLAPSHVNKRVIITLVLFSGVTLIILVGLLCPDVTSCAVSFHIFT